MTTDSTDAHTLYPELAGRRAIITGGTTGIGRAIAVLLASEGVKVFTCGRDPDHLRDALERINEVGEGDGVALDVTEQASLEEFFGKARDYLGEYDIAVINAAVPAKAVGEVDGTDLRYQIAADFTAYIASAHAAVNDMEAGSDIVLIGSMSAVSLDGGSSIYTAAKSGVQGFSVALREELAEKDIKVGLIEPGFTGADFQYPEFPPEKQREMIAADQMLRAEDIAVATQFMLRQPRRAAVSLIRVETRLSHSG